MFDPMNPINYKRSRAEMEELLLFLMCVTGKDAVVQSKALDRFFFAPIWLLSTFTQIRLLLLVGQLRNRLEHSRLGQYTRLTRGMRELVELKLDLRTARLEDLMKVHGVGRKSASCFLMWTRPRVRVSGLDTHLLKYLNKVRDDLKGMQNAGLKLDVRDRGILNSLESVKIPKTTPSSKKMYDWLEGVYLQICDRSQKDPTEWDLQIWKHYSKGLPLI